MRLWTFQSLAAWRHLTKTGALHTTAAHIDSDLNYNGAYDWMVRQMQRRMPAHSGHYPIWALPYAPDDATCAAYTSATEDLVLMELEVPPERVLLSDYHLWHSVLNNAYCARTEAEDDAFERRYRYPYTGHAERVVERSWQRIFAFNKPWWRRPDVINWLGAQQLPQDLQACVDGVYLRELMRDRLIPAAVLSG